MPEGSTQDLLAAIRELEVFLRGLEVRIRVLEQKQIQGEGDLRNLLTKTDLQITKLVSDTAVEKESRHTDTARLERALESASAQSDKLGVKLDGINNKIVWATGAMAVIIFLANLLVKFFIKGG